MTSSQIWPCHVISVAYFESFLSWADSPLNFRKTCQIWCSYCFKNKSYDVLKVVGGIPRPPMWNRVKVNTAKHHGKDDIKVGPLLIRHLLRNRLLKWDNIIKTYRVWNLHRHVQGHRKRSGQYSHGLTRISHILLKNRSDIAWKTMKQTV